jgi:mevalonate kinase
MKPFTSKILLFGEYTILNGGMALAIPFSNFSGKLVLPCNNELPSQKAVTSNQSIKRWVKFLTEQTGFNSPPNEQKLLFHALLGLYFDSNIPQGYGVGSSGALTAAIYNQYFCASTEYQTNPTISIQELKADLSLMESFFHGSSSGIDPLVSYLNEPLLIKNGLVFKQPLALSNELKIFLIDTGSPAATGNLIQLFHKKMESPTLKPDVAKLSTLTDQIIESFCNSNISFDRLEELSLLQQSVFKEMFLFNETIEDAIRQFKGSLSIKLCGSGGGGYLLGFTKPDEYQSITQFLSDHGVAVIPINEKAIETKNKSFSNPF